jgi:hypothetical protein
MSRKARKPKADSPTPEEEARALKIHLRDLGLASVEQYKQFCRKHSFSLKTNKSSRQRERERLIVSRQAAERRLSQSRRERRNTKTTIAQILDGDIKKDEVRHPGLRLVCLAYESTQRNRRAKHALRDILLHLNPASAFFDNRPAIVHLGWQLGNTYVEALAAMAFFYGCRRRPVEQWRPRSHNVWRQFASLARHLFADYDVPPFLDEVWFRGVSTAAQERQGWFIHMAHGLNIRTAKLPVALTKRMAHHFMQAPKNYSVEAALRWGQIHGLGGDARLADAIRATRLAEHFDHDVFWVSVLRFFIANPMLDTAHIGPIVDYLHDQRFAPRNVFVERGVMEQHPAAQPNLTMRGRSVTSLLAQVRRWHRQLAKEPAGNVEWPKSDIGEFVFVEGRKESGNMRRWTLRELLSGKALNAEGRSMRHCVASYSSSCARRTTSIWSLEVEGFEGHSKVLTVEVRLGQKLICQARGKNNKPPDEKSRSVLRRWAEQEGLTLAPYL